MHLAAVIATHPFVIVLLILTVALSACDRGAQGAASSPTPNRFRLSGVVRRTTGLPIAGATLAILDGGDAGARVTSDSGGNYSFPALAPGTFTVRAVADSHTAASRSVTIAAADVAADFVLTRAELVLEGNVTYQAQGRPEEAWTFSGSVLNRGDACATDVRGYLSRVDDEGEPLEGQTRAFALPPAALVHPSERFQFAGCCFSRTELAATALVRVEFVFQSVECSR
jgi:hypothetical protein